MTMAVGVDEMMRADSPLVNPQQPSSLISCLNVSMTEVLPSTLTNTHSAGFLEPQGAENHELLQQAQHSLLSKCYVHYSHLKNTSFAHLGFNKCLSLALICRRKRSKIGITPRCVQINLFLDLCGHFVVTHP